MQGALPASRCSALAIAGFAASAFSLPFDFVKTQIQRMKPEPVTGEMPFKGPIDCAMKQVKMGGVRRNKWARSDALQALHFVPRSGERNQKTPCVASDLKRLRAIEDVLSVGQQ